MTVVDQLLQRMVELFSAQAHGLRDVLVDHLTNRLAPNRQESGQSQRPPMRSGSLSVLPLIALRSSRPADFGAGRTHHFPRFTDSTVDEPACSGASSPLGSIAEAHCSSLPSFFVCALIHRTFGEARLDKPLKVGAGP